MSSANNEGDSPPAQLAPPSTFAERFQYSRDRQRVRGTYQSDKELAVVLGLKSQSQITEYKGRVDAPDGDRTFALAKVLDVDPGWLAFGSDSKAPAPEGFPVWLVSHQMRQQEMRRLSMDLDELESTMAERNPRDRAGHPRDSQRVTPEKKRSAERPVTKTRAAGGRGRKR